MKPGTKVSLIVGGARTVIGEVVGPCWAPDGRPDSYGSRLLLVKFPDWTDPLAVHPPNLRVLTPLEQLAHQSDS